MSESAWILVVAALVSTSCALCGVFLVLRRLAMLGDAISHTVLFGIVVTFLATGSRAAIPMLIGATLVGLLTAFLTTLLTRQGRLQEDASIGVVFTWLFASAVILVSLFADHVELDQECVLYGELALVPFDVLTIGGTSWGPRAFWMLLPVTLLNLVFVALTWRRLSLVAFDPTLASLLGVQVALWHYQLMGLVSLTIVASFESVGAILVVALLVLPAASAYLFARSVPQMLLLAVLFGLVATLAGYWFATVIDGSIAAAIATAGTVLFLLAFGASLVRHRSARRSAQRLLGEHPAVSG